MGAVFMQFERKIGEPVDWHGVLKKHTFEDPYVFVFSESDSKFTWLDYLKRMIQCVNVHKSKQSFDKHFEDIVKPFFKDKLKSNEMFNSIVLEKWPGGIEKTPLTLKIYWDIIKELGFHSGMRKIDLLSQRPEMEWVVV